MAFLADKTNLATLVLTFRQWSTHKYTYSLVSSLTFYGLTHKLNVAEYEHGQMRQKEPSKEHQLTHFAQSKCCKETIIQNQLNTEICILKF